MDCYNQFAHVYDELIHGDVNYEQWAKVIVQICDEKKIKREEYLDLACGTGNLMQELAKEFRTTWGVDLSSEMLSEAEKKMRERRIKAKLVCQNIANLCLNKKFDLITSCLDSTNYILEEEQLESYFQGVYTHLKQDGIFIFDLNSYYKLTERIGNESFHYVDENIAYIWENSMEEEVINMYLTFFVKEGDAYIRFDEEHFERAYKEEVVEKILRETGFIIIDKLDNYEFKPIHTNTERIVYVVQKKE